MGDLIKIIRDNYENDKSKIFEAINSGRYDLGQVEPTGYTALVYACQEAMPDVAMALIQTGQSHPEIIPRWSNSALMWACINNMEDVITALLQTGQSNPGYVINDKTALMYACKHVHNNKPIIDLIQTGESKPGQVNNDGDTALIIASQHYWHTEAALALIETGESKPEQVNRRQITALRWACWSGNKPLAMALIQTGQSNPGIVDDEHFTALMWACKQKVSEVALALLQTGESKPGHVDEEENKNTALIFACEKNMPEVAMALIQTGESKPGQVNRLGNTALAFACQNNMPEVALALIQTGQSKPGQVDYENTTSLIYACKNNMPEVAMALIQTGQSKPEKIGKQGNTALIYACENNMSELAIALIQTRKSKPEKVNKKGNSAFKYAIQNNMTDVIRMLEELGLQRPEPPQPPQPPQPQQPSQPQQPQQPPQPPEQFNLNANGFNAMLQETVKIDDYLKRSRDNLCFKINDSYFLISKQEILTQFNNKQNIKFGCKEAGNQLSFTLDNNIIRNKKYLTMSALLGLQILVDVQQIRDIMSDRTSNTFYLNKSTTRFPAIISQAYLDGAGGIGADYCQEGKARDVYNIIKAVPVYGETEVLPEQPIEATETRELKIQYKTYTFSFPVTETTTIEEMKTALLEKLVSENLITSTNQNVKFIYKGKIYTDGSVVLSSLENPPFNITLQAMVSPRVGGTKKYRKIRKSGNRKTKKIYRNRKTRKTERRKGKRNKYTINKK